MNSLCGRRFGVSDRLEEEPIFQSHAHAEVEQLLAAKGHENIVTELARPCLQERQIALALDFAFLSLVCAAWRTPQAAKPPGLGRVEHTMQV